MAILQIKNKRIIKHDTSNPNYKPDPTPKLLEPVVNGNTTENKDKGVYQSEDDTNNIYGEDMKNMMTSMMDKIDNIKVKNGNINIYDEKNAVEVDVKRNVFLSKPDEYNVKIDKVKKGKVNNKVNKLRELRRNGR